MIRTLVVLASLATGHDLFGGPSPNGLSSCACDCATCPCAPAKPVARKAVAPRSIKAWYWVERDGYRFRVYGEPDRSGWIVWDRSAPENAHLREPVVQTYVAPPVTYQFQPAARFYTLPYMAAPTCYGGVCR